MVSLLLKPVNDSKVARILILEKLNRIRNNVNLRCEEQRHRERLLGVSDRTEWKQPLPGLSTLRTWITLYRNNA
jgi:hypothetical protein